jgi:hypothetical protein
MQKAQTSSGLEVSAIGLGANYGPPANRQEMISFIRAAWPRLVERAEVPYRRPC